MFKHSIIVVLAISALLLSACSFPSIKPNGIKGSGKYITKDFQMTGFKGINTCCGFAVTVTGGDSYKVTVRAEDNIMDYIVVQKEGDNLKVGLDTTRFTSFSTGGLDVAVTMPELQAVSLSGGARLTTGGTAPKGSDLLVDASGGSQVNLESMATQKARVALSGGAKATINVTGSLDYSLSGGAQLRYRGKPSIGRAEATGGTSAGQID